MRRRAVDGEPRGRAADGGDPGRPSDRGPPSRPLRTGAERSVLRPPRRAARCRNTSVSPLQTTVFCDLVGARERRSRRAGHDGEPGARPWRASNSANESCASRRNRDARAEFGGELGGARQRRVDARRVASRCSPDRVPSRPRCRAGRRGPPTPTARAERQHASRRPAQPHGAHQYRRRQRVVGERVARRIRQHGGHAAAGDPQVTDAARPARAAARNAPRRRARWRPGRRAACREPATPGPVRTSAQRRDGVHQLEVVVTVTARRWHELGTRADRRRDIRTQMVGQHARAVSAIQPASAFARPRLRTRSGTAPGDFDRGAVRAA